MSESNDNYPSRRLFKYRIKIWLIIGKETLKEWGSDSGISLNFFIFCSVLPTSIVINYKINKKSIILNLFIFRWRHIQKPIGHHLNYNTQSSPRTPTSCIVTSVNFNLLIVFLYFFLEFPPRDRPSCRSWSWGVFWSGVPPRTWGSSGPAGLWLRLSEPRSFMIWQVRQTFHYRQHVCRQLSASGLKRLHWTAILAEKQAVFTLW